MRNSLERLNLTEQSQGLERLPIDCQPKLFIYRFLLAERSHSFISKAIRMCHKDAVYPAKSSSNKTLAVKQDGKEKGINVPSNTNHVILVCSPS